MEHASPEEHALVFLEHHRHAVAIVMFLTYAGPVKDTANRGFRVILYTRFGGDVVNPSGDAPTFTFDDDTGLPLIVLELYNSTGNGMSGCHCDLVLLHAARPRRDASPNKRQKREHIPSSNTLVSAHRVQTQHATSGVGVPVPAPASQVSRSYGEASAEHKQVLQCL